MQLSIEHDLNTLEKQLNSLGKKAFVPALNSVLNREGDRSRTAAIREVAQVQRIQQKLIREKTKTRRSNFRTLTYSVEFDHRGITWGRVSPRVIGSTKRGKGRGVRAGKHAHRHAFIRRVSGRSGGVATTQVLVRDVNHPDYDGRYPLRVLRVRLRVPLLKAFEAQSKSAGQRVIRSLEKEISRRVELALRKSK